LVTLASLALFLFGTYLLYVGGVPVVVVGLAAIAVSLLYSLEITDLPLHDLNFFRFFGPVSVAGTYYVQAAAVLADSVPPCFPPGSFPLGAVIAGVPIGAITTAILVVDNIRDLEYDRPKDDVTLAVVIGERWSRVEYNLLLFGAYAVLPALWLGLEMSAGVVLPLASLPLAVLVAHRMSRARSYPALLPLSPRTGQVLLVFAALLAVGSTL
ncbi:MAG: prenyltransferase, partial [Halobacteriota archaeon]